MKHLLATTALAFSIAGTFHASAQSTHRPALSEYYHPTLPAVMNKTFTNPVSGTTVNKGTAFVQRLIAVKSDFGTGQDSIVYFYSGTRGSMAYNVDNGFDYDGGYNFLYMPYLTALYDSTHYITRKDYVSPFAPYLNDYAWYDATNRYTRRERHTANSAGIIQLGSRNDVLRNTNGDIVYDLTRKFNKTTLVYDTSKLNTYGYAGVGKVNDLSSYKWPSATSGRRGIGRTKSFYNTQGDVYLQQMFLYDTTAKNWQTLPYARASNSYDASHHLLLSIIELYNAGAWDSTDRARYSYNTNGQLTHEMHDTYMAPGWDSLSSEHYTYTAGVPFYTKYELSANDGTSWVVNITYKHRIVNAQNLISIDSMVDYSTPGDTVKVIINYAWNSYGNPTTRKVLALDANGTPAPDTVQRMVDTYYYELYNNGVGIPQVAAKVVAATVYPNPATSEVTIRCADMQHATLTITNSLGQTVRSHEVTLGNGEAVIPVNNFSSGIYFITLSDAQHNTSAAIRMVKN